MTVFMHIQECLEGLPFPASRKEAVQYAKEHDAPEMVLRALEILPEKEYDSAEEIVAETVTMLV